MNFRLRIRTAFEHGNMIHHPSGPELFIIGLGVQVPDQITPQATKAMADCSKIYSIVQEPERLWLPKGMLGKIEVFNALRWYSEGSLRSQNYERVARAILKELETSPTIGYVTYGNPMAYDRVAQNLANMARDSGFTAKVVPGISSIDTVLCDLTLDMAPGIQVFEASWMVACEIQPNINTAMLLVQVGAFGSLRTHYTKRQDGSTLTELVKYLSAWYPSSHGTILVRCASQEGQPSGITRASLANLWKATAEQLSGASLYVPPLIDPIPRRDIIDRMKET